MTESQEIILQLSTLSYGSIWIVSLLSNVVIPVPEEVILLALGYLAGTGKINIFVLIPLVISALLTSDIIMFTLSKNGNRFLKIFYNRFFARRLAKRGESWMGHNIGKVIFFSRFLVQLRFIGPFMAGQKGISLKKFVTYDIAALLVYVPFFTFLGWYFHKKVHFIIEDISIVKNSILIIVGLTLMYALFKFVYRILFIKPPKIRE